MATVKECCRSEVFGNSGDRHAGVLTIVTHGKLLLSVLLTLEAHWPVASQNGENGAPHAFHYGSYPQTA